ncbi:MAG TPA: glycoside hydrolase family 3 N-terminal domain-containing protein [Thermodesulfobacteriota bacterium]|nr:glycoside hydrolase family 3 N-terminal domain-containing protein [Thermodesulfobacteriota bacterium]
MILKIVFFLIAAISPLALPSALAASDDADRILSRMSLPEKIGQLMWVGFQGPALTAQDREHLRKVHPGGIVLFTRNLQGSTEVRRLADEIQAALGKKGLPVFIAIDQEGGIVHRGDWITPPSHPAIGAADSEPLSLAVGRAVGIALGQSGFNINLAPVLDMPAPGALSPMLMRSLGTNPAKVRSLGQTYIRGIHESGLMACAKHFPGIGKAKDDSHFRLPRVPWKSQAEREDDLLPFRGAIGEGVDMVMPGHFLAEPGDADHPVSLSSYWMEEVLRKDMGFSGLTVVDNMEMKALEGLMPLSDAVVRAFHAGADILMVNHERKNQEMVFRTLLRAVEKGDISKERLESSLQRIVGKKKKIQMPYAIEERGPGLKDLSRQVAENSVARIRRKHAPAFAAKREDPGLYAGFNSSFISAFREAFPRGEILNTSLPMFEKSSRVPVSSFLKKFEFLLVDASYPDARDLISAAEKMGKRTTAIAFPTQIPAAAAALRPAQILILFDGTRPQIDAALEILGGTREAKGKNPFWARVPDGFTD